ncbi:hypothetical protein [Chryseobacterium viscerum]|uniref:TonB C-terminal domain-containing protein n=1 Tax=Chryseobacterium viscerum TaxID=1037377 RepID=A0A5N4BTV8_9FLAO|nr:hypothetical protein [Chryseobacterium viscerum]KAB1231856.1 hypothetical protein F8D52_04250 [Chryseobacterium viscerum]
MKSLFALLFLFLSFVINAQLKEVKQLKSIEKKYDSIVISYQKKAKDSLSYLKKSDRNEIMAKEEGRIHQMKKEEEYAQLKKIKEEEQELVKLNLPEKHIKCDEGAGIQMPDLLIKPKYKPTVSRTTKQNSKGDNSELTTVVTFSVTADGYIKNVNAVGNDDDFNKQSELTLYKIEKITPRCIGGISRATIYKLPVRMTFNN